MPSTPRSEAVEPGSISKPGKSVLAYGSIAAAFIAGSVFGLLAGLWLFSEGPRELRASSSEIAGVTQSTTATAPLSPATGNLEPALPPSPSDIGTSESIEPLAAMIQLVVLDNQRREIARFPTAPLGKDRILVLPLSLLSHSAAVRLDTGEGQTRMLAHALALDTGSNLIALDSGNGWSPYLALSDEDHPLFLGRNVILITAQERIRGWVDGFGMPLDDSSADVIPIRLERVPQTFGGVLLDPGSSRLLGLVVSPLDQDTLIGALDVNTIREFLDRIDTTQPQAIRVVLDEYLQSTPTGLWARMQQRAAMEDFPDTLDTAEKLLAIAPEYQEKVLHSLEQMLVDTVMPQLDRGRHRQILAWLDAAERIMGDNGRLYWLYGNAYLALKDLRQARAYFIRAMEVEPDMSEQILSQLRRIILAEVRQLDDELADERVVTLLQESIRLDPEFAPYHRHLGRQYFKQGRYAAAIATLDRAMALDGSLSESLITTQINEAYLRLDSPAQTHVPFRQGTGVMYVDVRLNNQPESFRFILDTGASHTAISRRLAQRLGITSSDYTHRVRVRTANGTSEAPLVTLESVELRGARLDNIPALILDRLDHVDGLIGMSYLRFFKVEIEHDQGYLVLTRK